MLFCILYTKAWVKGLMHFKSRYTSVGKVDFTCVKSDQRLHLWCDLVALLLALSAGRLTELNHVEMYKSSQKMQESCSRY